jgi:hypothetical protein
MKGMEMEIDRNWNKIIYSKTPNKLKQPTYLISSKAPKSAYPALLTK